MSELICTAVIGLGNISDRHRANLKILNPNVIVYVLSSSGKVVSELPINADFVAESLDELLNLELDLVIVASPSTYHLDHALPFVRKGVPVLVEKPVVASLAAEELKLVELTNSKSVGVGYCLRFMPAVSVVKSLLDQEFFGEIYNINIQVGQYLPDWRSGKDFRQSVSASKSLGGGALLELSHELDYVQWLFGDIELEYASIRSSRELGLDVEDMADMVFKVSDDVICNIHLDLLQKLPIRTCSIVGEKNRLDWDLIGNNIQTSNENGQHEIFADPDWDRNSMYTDMLNDFLMGDYSKIASVNDSLKVVKLIEEIKQFKYRKTA